MYIEQLYTGCLAEAAYYIESNGEVAIIDPIRETEPYIEMAKARNAKIKYIFETHFHADFVSGHIDLAKKVGADIVYGPKAQTNYDAIIAEDNQVFELGGCKIKVIHTPGHTLESSCYLLSDENGKEQAIFTGDTLFIGDVGRPDLAIKSDLTKEDLAGLLYDSLTEKILPLSDDITVYPAHGAGSACGKNMSKDTFDLLGNQKKTNYALQPMSKENFVKEVTCGIMPPPQYFPKAAAMNKNGYLSLEEILKNGNNALTLESFENQMSESLILDTRKQKDFCEGHIPNSLFIGIDGSFAVWAGAIITNMNQPILIIADEGREEEVITRLARVGYDNVLGYLSGGFETWKNANRPCSTLLSISPNELEKLIKENASLNVVDVRKPGEYEDKHVKNVVNLPLDFIAENHVLVNTDSTCYIHCRSGYRSVIAASIYRQNGIENVVDVSGGFVGIEKETNLPMIADSLATT